MTNSTHTAAAAVVHSAFAPVMNYTGMNDALNSSSSYKQMTTGNLFTMNEEPAKWRYNYDVKHGETHHYFEYGIAPLAIFIAAIFSVFWGTLAGLLVKRVNMDDYTSIETCILKYGKTDEQVAITGGHKQASAQDVMDTLKLVGTKITEVSFLKSIIKHDLFCPY